MLASSENQINLNPTNINGVDYVAVSDLSKYSLTPRRRQINFTPKRPVFDRINNYCELNGTTKAAFLNMAVEHYFDSLIQH